MKEHDASHAVILETIRRQIDREQVRFTAHAHAEMVEEAITLAEVFQALAGGEILENYPKHQRGACCLVGGFSKTGRPLHVVCTTANPLLVVIPCMSQSRPNG
jgi:hypothetical protein